MDDNGRWINKSGDYIGYKTESGVNKGYIPSSSEDPQRAIRDSILTKGTGELADTVLRK